MCFLGEGLIPQCTLWFGLLLPVFEGGELHILIISPGWRGIRKINKRESKYGAGAGFLKIEGEGADTFLI